MCVRARVMKITIGQNVIFDDAQDYCYKLYANLVYTDYSFTKKRLSRRLRAYRRKPKKMNVVKYYLFRMKWRALSRTDWKQNVSAIEGNS